MNIYHKRFLESFSAESVIGLFSRYKGAAKEITESWAMLEAANNHCLNLDSHHIIVVGDGCSPRTGAIFAYFTKAMVTSVDPGFNLSHWQEHVAKQTAMGFPPQRLEVIQDYIDKTKIDCHGRPLLVIWPHSHAHMNECNPVNHGLRTDIAMPCCVKVPKNWLLKPHSTYDDENVISPKRTIHVWQPGSSV